MGLVSLSHVVAQGPVIIDTVITGVGYGTNVWYSLQNDEQGLQFLTIGILQLELLLHKVIH